jgi:hypothetical protein
VGSILTDIVIFLKNFRQKKQRLWLKTKTKECKNLIITLFFEKSAIFSAKNCQKPHKIMIIPPTSGRRILI